MPLKLTLTLQPNEAIDGQSIEAFIQLDNPNGRPLQVPDPEGPCQYEFVLKRLDRDQPALVLSAEAAALARSSDPRPEIPAQFVDLPPKGQLKDRRSLSRFAVDPIPPGRYSVTVAWGQAAERAESAPTPLTVTPAHPLALATGVYEVDKSLLLVLAHQAADKSIVLFQRESGMGRPAEGLAYRRRTIQAPATVEGVAHAVSSPEEPGPWWFAWLQQGALGAELTEANTSKGSIQPIPLGLKSPRLFPQGWQSDWKTALFAALGIDAQSRPALAIVRMDATNWTGNARVLPLPASTLPRHAALGFQETGEQPRLALVWAEEANRATRIRAMMISPGEASAGEPHDLVTREEPCAALALNPLLVDAPGIVDVLFGPAGKPRQLTLARLPLDGSPPVTQWQIPDDPDPGHPEVTTTAWTLPSTPIPDPVILAEAGGRLLFRRASSGDRWSVLSETASKADHRRLEVLGGQVWAIWADPDHGLQYRLLR